MSADEDHVWRLAAPSSVLIQGSGAGSSPGGGFIDPLVISASVEFGKSFATGCRREMVPADVA